MTDRNNYRSDATGPVDQTEKPLVRDDGSKVATEGSPSGETETEKVQREEAKLPNRGISPNYIDPVDGDGTAVVDHPPQNEHDELIVDDDGLDPPDEDENQPGLPGEPALEKSNTLQKP